MAVQERGDVLEGHGRAPLDGLAGVEPDVRRTDEIRGPYEGMIRRKRRVFFIHVDTGADPAFL